VEKIRQLIVEAGRDPVERDTVYHHIHRDANNFKEWTVGEEVTTFQHA
jgi:aminodeoxyfutalosine synthase